MKWVALAVAGLLLLAVAAYALSRWLGPTAAQERALAVMTDRSPPVGRNAFARLWLMPYDIPAGRHREVLARDVAAYAGRGDSDLSAFVSTAHGRFADVRESMDRWPPLCDSDAAQCLRDVRARRDEYAGWRGRHRELVDRAALEGFAYYSNPFDPDDIARPLPPVSLALQARRTSHALDFVEGRRQVALDGVCRDVATWRRLGANADTLIGYFVGTGAVDASARLFAQMLAQSPAGEPLPASCGAALAPPTAQELSLCEAMRGEFALTQAALAQMALDEGWMLAFHPRMAAARMAVTHAQHCSPAMQQAIVQDRPLPPPVSPPSRFSFECIANMAGCILGDIAAPAYHDYSLRAQDHGARLRLLATVRWLHERRDDDRPLAERLAVRPATLRSPQHPVEVVADGGGLRIAERSPPQRHWQLPLNPALR